VSSKPKAKLGAGKSAKSGEKALKYDTRWKPGQSGNPAGRPKASAGQREAKALAKEHTAAAIATLAEILKDKKATASARVAAATAILDRGHGKPLQQVEIGEAGVFSDMSDEELEAWIDDATVKLGYLKAAGHA
jgi:hypothetical protein